MRTETSFRFRPDKEKLSSLPDHLVLLSGNSNKDLAGRVAKELGMQIGYPIQAPFADGESNIQIAENLRNRDVAIIQSTSMPAATNIWELALIADAARRASGNIVTAAIPYFGFARQDRKDRPRVPISAAVASRTLEHNGVNRIVTVDLHSPQIAGGFTGAWDELTAKKAILPQIEKIPTDNLMIVSPDLGGEKRAFQYAQLLGADWATISKLRDPDVKNKSFQHGINGNVEGMDCVLVDDMIDTGGTIVSAAHLLLANGATSVSVAATHGVFSGEAVLRLHESPISQVIITDTIKPSRRVGEMMHRSGKFRKVTVAPIIAHAIYSNQTGDSLSQALF